MIMDDDDALGTGDDGHAAVQVEQVSTWGDIRRGTAHGYNNESAVAGESVCTIYTVREALWHEVLGSEVIRNRFDSEPKLILSSWQDPR